MAGAPERIRADASGTWDTERLGSTDDEFQADYLLASAVDQALVEEENYYANVGGDSIALRSARDTLGALARVRAKLDAKKPVALLVRRENASRYLVIRPRQ